MNLQTPDTEKLRDCEHEETPFEVNRPEGGLFGWLIVVAAACCMGFLQSINYSLINNEFIKIYNTTDNHVIYAAWIGALSSSLDLLCSSPASFVTDVIGPRKMAMIGGTLISTGLILSGFVRSLKLYFLTLSLLPAIGSAAVRSAVCAIIPNYFVKRLGLATGIVYSIASVITVTSPFLVAYLLEALGMQKTFLIMGSYYIAIIVLATSFKSVLPRKKLTSFKEILKDSTKIGILKNPNYLCWIISSMFAYYGATFLLLAVIHHSNLNFAGSKHELLNVLYAVFCSVTSIISGKLNDYWPYSKIYFHTISALIYGAAEIFIPYAPSFIYLCVVMSTIGIADGFYFSASLAICQEIFSSSRLVNQAMGYFYTFMAMPIIIGPVIAALIFEKFGSYYWGFLHGGIACLLCFAIQIFYPNGVLVKYFKCKSKDIRI